MIITNQGWQSPVRQHVLPTCTRAIGKPPRFPTGQVGQRRRQVGQRLCMVLTEGQAGRDWKQQEPLHVASNEGKI